MSYKEYTVRVYSDPDCIRWHKLGTTISHREDGPAVEYANGEQIWYKDGHVHREDGPAMIYSSGYKEWWINGMMLSEADFNYRYKSSCEGKIIEIDGKKYQLKEV